MRKLIFASSVALLALSGAALADGGNRSLYNSHVSNGTSSLDAKLDITRSETQTNTQITKYQQDNYNGIGTYTNAEHGGVSEIKTSGKAGAASLGVNAAVANATGRQGTAELNANLGVSAIPGLIPSVNANLGASVGATGLQAGSSSISGSGLVAGAVGGGSVKASSAGYASGSAVAQREWGSSNQTTNQQQWQNVKNLTANVAASRTR